jgi:CheY-like chemotaxis protein
MSSRPLVLVVDDSRTARTHLQLLLGASYACEAFGTGEEVLARLAKAPRPLAVLLDVNMPGLGGVETLRRVKADPALAGLPVVMVTTRGEEETRGACAALGCDGFVTKPVQTGELFTVLRQLPAVGA